MDDGELRPLIDEMLHGADDAGAEERAAVFGMAWDFVGSSSAARGFLYERFYLTSAARNKQMMHSRDFDRTRSRALLNDMLSRGGGWFCSDRRQAVPRRDIWMLGGWRGQRLSAP